MKFGFGWKKLKNWINRLSPSQTPVVACVCGMHRSGTSMASQLLSRSGVYMGPEESLTVSAQDNQDGFWEDEAFVKINDEILSHFFGGWDLPPSLEDGWQYSPELSDIRDRAHGLIEQRRGYKAWGWKDPRSSITIPFWMSLFPGMKVVICLRHPWEVAQSLHRRNFMSIPCGLTLWEAYEKRVLADTRPENRIITHYESYFIDPRAELERILDFLAVQLPEDLLSQAASTCKGHLRNNRCTKEFSLTTGSRPIAELYEEMCAQSGPVYHKSREAESRIA